MQIHPILAITERTPIENFTQFMPSLNVPLQIDSPNFGTNWTHRTTKYSQNATNFDAVKVRLGRKKLDEDLKAIENVKKALEECRSGVIYMPNLIQE